MAVAEPQREPKRLPELQDWLILGVLDTGRGLVDVRHIVKVASAMQANPGDAKPPVTGILSTTHGICYVYRPWSMFLAEYYEALHCLRPG